LFQLYFDQSNLQVASRWTLVKAAEKQQRGSSNLWISKLGLYQISEEIWTKQTQLEKRRRRTGGNAL